MRLLPLLAATILLVVSPFAARAQSVGGGIGVSARVVAAEELKLASAMGAAGAEQVRVERTRGGDASLSVPLVLTHRARPVVSLQQRAGDPTCELLTAASSARTDAGWGTRLRCTANAAGAPQWARLLIVPNT